MPGDGNCRYLLRDELAAHGKNRPAQGSLTLVKLVSDWFLHTDMLSRGEIDVLDDHVSCLRVPACQPVSLPAYPPLSRSPSRPRHATLRHPT